LAKSRRRTSDAYGALVFLARQTFVDPQRVAVIGFSQGGWVASQWPRLISSSCSSFQTICGFVWRLRSILYAGPPGHARGYPLSFLLEPSTIGHRPKTAHARSSVGAPRDPRSSKSSIPALTMVSITRTSSPAGRSLVTGWNTTATQRTKQASGCGSFSITISTDGVPIGAAELTSAEGQNRCGPCVRCQGKNKSGHDRLARQSLRQHAPLPAPVRSAHSDEEAGALTGVACRRAPSPRATRRGVSGADEAITTSRARTHLPCRSFAALLRRP
jgi:hypothetical protein